MYASVNDLDMYYQEHGSGDPLVLLHGGLITIDVSFGELLPVLATTRRVIAVEQQGHGHTPDIDRPLTFDQMADDTAALLRQVGVERADLFGYSDGGIVALGMAIRHPDLVRKLVVAGTNFNNDGLYPEILDFFRHVTIDDLGDLGDDYAAVAPNPAGWPALVAKVFRQALEFPGWRADDLRAIRSPTFVIAGDDDIIRPEHAVELYRLIPNARLAILPGTDHQQIVKRADWLLSMIPLFLDTPMPESFREEPVAVT